MKSAGSLEPQTIKMSAVHSQSSSDALIEITANIEGLTANEASVLSELYKDKGCHCLYLQETQSQRSSKANSWYGASS